MSYLGSGLYIKLSDMDLEKKVEQPTKDSADTSKQPDANNGSKAIDLGNGQEVTQDELIKGYLRQQDYTKKTQELSKKKEELNLSDEDLETFKKLKASGFATVDELESFKKEQAEKEDYTNFVSNVELSENQLKLVSDLKKVNPEKSYQEIAKDYWIIDQAKIDRVKGIWSFKWNSFAIPASEEEFKVDVTKAGYNPEQAAKVAKMKF